MRERTREKKVSLPSYRLRHSGLVVFVGRGCMRSHPVAMGTRRKYRIKWVAWRRWTDPGQSPA